MRETGRKVERIGLNEPMADLVALLGNVLFHFLNLKESANVVLLDSALSCSVSDQP